MRSTFFILLNLLFLNNILTAQSIFFADSINWEKSQVLIDVGLNKEYVLYSDACFNRYDDLLPMYSSKQNVNSKLKVDNFSIVNASYEQVNIDSFKQVKNLDKIPEDFEISFSNSVFRKTNNLSISIMPVRRNPSSGQIEVLKTFEIRANCVEDYSRNNNRYRSTYASSSALASGKWHKIKVNASGIYKIKHSDLIDMGFSDMSSIGVFGFGGILSYIAGESYIDDLPERPVFKVDVNGNGVFDSGDYFLFYADGPNSVDYNLGGNFTHELNSCSNWSYYFISDKGSWKQATTIESLDNFDIDVFSFDDYVFLEKDSVNLIKSGRNPYWRHFSYRLNHNFYVNIPNLSTSDPVNVRIEAAARSSVPSEMSVVINGSSKQNMKFNKVSLGSETGNYAAADKKDYEIYSSSNNFNFNLSYVKSTSSSEAWLDFISLKFRRKLQLLQGQVVFRDLKSISAGQKARFNISNATNKTVVWDISNRFFYNSIKGSISNSVLSFISPSDELKEYVAFDYSKEFPSPQFKGEGLGFVNNQNLHSLGFADIIVVTHKDFYNQARKLAEIHSDFDGMSSHVVVQEDIFNEFSSGSPSVSAIRNFVKMFYDRANSDAEIPNCLVLFGDGSYDNLSPDESVSNQILTYQTRESLNLTNSVVCDDFFGYLDNGEGNINLSDDIDVGVGRITVKSHREADDYIEKLRSYYSPRSFGNYKNSIVVLGDDADENQPIHQQSANRIANNIEKISPESNVAKLFLDSYQQVSTSSGESYPDLNQEIDDYINSGIGLITWAGHGSPRSWAHERILSIDMIKKWKNIHKYPIFVTATCSFAPFDDHGFVSGGEEVLLAQNAGGIALLTTTRIAYAGPNESMTNAFFNQLFTKDNKGKNQTIGMSSAKAKNSLSGDSNKRIFTVLGDPAIRYFSPTYKVETSKINGVDIDDFTDLIKAKELVKFEGQILKQDGSLANNFNGVIYPTVFDKKMKYETRDNEGFGSLVYTSQKNILFNGKASVKNGKFSFSFIVPVDIAYFNDRGKISYYANDKIRHEASGVDTAFFVGGSFDSNLTDKQGPIIDLFFNDEQFIPGSVVNESPILLANVQDESGVNTIGNGIGHDITLLIDDKTANTIVLNKFYESELDDFTRGKINYPMSNLAVGPHIITVKAWDVLNNSSVSTLDCIVANSEDLVLEHIFNYPNPFTTNTSFYFDHNQPFVRLDVLVQVYTVTGKHVKTIHRDMVTTGYISDPIIWDGKDDYGDKIGKGVYIYKIKVRTQNGLNADKFEKLVILK